MQSSSTRSTIRGFTLVEFLITTFVVAVALLVSMMIAGAMSKQMRTEHHRIGAQDNARVAIDEVTRLLRGAGSQTDQSRGQSRFVFAGPFTVSFNANLTPLIDPDGSGTPQAVDVDLANPDVPLGAGLTYTPPRTFNTGAETIVLTLDSSRDGYVNSSDTADDEEEDSDNPRDFVLKSFVYGSDGTANTVEETGIAVLRGPLADNSGTLPAPLFQYWLDTDDDRTTPPELHGDTDGDGQLSQSEIAGLGAVPTASLAEIERVDITTTAEAEKETDPDYFEPTQLRSSVSFRNRNNTAGRVVGRVFHDNNKNGVQDETEVPLHDVTIRCSNGYTVKSNYNGLYNFILAPGTYTIQEVDGTGYVSTTPNTVPITIGPGEYMEVNFGDVSETGTGFIYGKVFNDLNEDGVRDFGESGIGGVQVFLDTGAYDYTDSTGSFEFSVAVGNYTVTEIDSTGFASSTPNVVDVNIAADGDSAHVLFGDYVVKNFGQIQGLVFLDNDNDGVFDPNESGIPNVSVSLADGDLAVTDVNGEFSFTLAPGDYKVTEQDPPNHTSSTVNTVSVTVAENEVVQVLFGDIGQEDVSFQEISLGDTERALSICSMEMLEDNRSDKDIVLGTHYVGGNNDILAWWNQRKNSSTPNSAIFDTTPTFQRAIDADVNVVLAHDMNQDGHDDVITGLASGSNNLNIWLTSTQDPTFGQLPNIPDARYTASGLQVLDLALGDFDGDSRTDIAVGLSSGFGIGRFEVWEGSGSSYTMNADGTYTTIPGSSITLGEVVAIESADFNADGYDDLVVAAQSSAYSSYVFLLLNDPTRSSGKSFARRSVFPVTGTIKDLLIVDMMEDNQGDLDIIIGTEISSTVGRVEVWHNDGSNAFGTDISGTLMPNDSSDPGGSPLSIQALRIDNDVFPDLVVGTRNGSAYTGDVVIYRAFGYLPLNGTVISSSGSGEVVTITSDDFNKDGAPDIAVGTRVSSTAGKVVVYFNEQTAF
jgi:hypothetical protein